MTNYGVNLNSGTTVLASSLTPISGGHLGNLTGKYIYVNSNTILDLDLDLHCDALWIGTSSNGINSNATLKFRSPYKTKFRPISPLYKDGRITWMTNGFYSSTGGSGLNPGIIYDLSPYGTHSSTTPSGIVETSAGPWSGASAWTHEAIGYFVPHNDAICTPKMSGLCWIYDEASTTDHFIFATEYLEFYIEGTTKYLHLDVFDGHGNSISSATTAGIPSQTWKHVGFSYDGRYTSFFIDGNLSRTVDNGYELLAGGTGTSTELAIGHTPAGSDDLNGKMSYLILFNDALAPFDFKSYYNLRESPPFNWGFFITESGNVINSTTAGVPGLNPNTSYYPGFDIDLDGIPVMNYPFIVQGTGFTATQYSLLNHSPGFFLQTSESGLQEDYSMWYPALTLLSIDDIGGDKPIISTQNRLGNISRVRKMGYTPREVTFEIRVDLSRKEGNTFLKRFEKLLSESFQERHTFDVITDKTVISGMQLTDGDENVVDNARWKYVDFKFTFQRKVP